MFNELFEMPLTFYPITELNYLQISRTQRPRWRLHGSPSCCTVEESTDMHRQRVGGIPHKMMGGTFDCCGDVVKRRVGL